MFLFWCLHLQNQKILVLEFVLWKTPSEQWEEFLTGCQLYSGTKEVTYICSRALAQASVHCHSRQPAVDIVQASRGIKTKQKQKSHSLACKHPPGLGREAPREQW